MAKKSFKEKGLNTILGTVKKEETPAQEVEISEEKKAKTEEAKKKAKVRLEERKKKVGRPKNPNKRVPTKSSQEGTKNNETRATFIVNEDLLEKLKNVAYWDRKKIKEVVGAALSDYVRMWEEGNGEVKQRPL